MASKLTAVIAREQSLARLRRWADLESKLRWGMLLEPHEVEEALAEERERAEVTVLESCDSDASEARSAGFDEGVKELREALMDAIAGLDGALVSKEAVMTIIQEWEL